MVKQIGALVMLALGCGAAGAAIVHKLQYNPPAMIERIIEKPYPAVKTDTPKRIPAKHTVKRTVHHHKRPQPGDTGAADELNRAQ